jgi:hypothetical protein
MPYTSHKTMDTSPVLPRRKVDPTISEINAALQTMTFDHSPRMPVRVKAPSSERTIIVDDDDGVKTEGIDRWSASPNAVTDLLAPPPTRSNSSEYPAEYDFALQSPLSSLSRSCDHEDAFEQSGNCSLISDITDLDFREERERADVPPSLPASQKPNTISPKNKISPNPYYKHRRTVPAKALLRHMDPPRFHHTK